MMMMEMMKVVSALVLFYCDCIDSSVKSPGFFFFVGFRLFTTSIPGHTAAEAVAPVRRPAVPSSRFFFFCSPE